MPESVRAAEDIWQALRKKRGPELLKGLVDEVAALYRICGELGRRFQQMQASLNLSEHLFALEEVTNWAPQLPTEIEINASQLLEPQEGFHNLEYDDNGLPFRWTGPQRHFSFGVGIDRRMPLTVELDVMWMIDESVQRELSLLADGKLLPFPLKRARSGYTGRAMLPPAERFGTTTLTFVVPQTLRPNPARADQRELGVAFRRLAIRPATAEDAKRAATPEDVRRRRNNGASARSATGVKEAPQPAPETTGVDRKPTLPETLSCTAADIVDGEPGFYHLEFDDDGIPFRWTGGQSSFSFSFTIPRQIPVEIELRAISAINLERQSPLELEVDGATHAVTLDWVDGRLAGATVIPPRQSAGPTVLTFTVPALLRPRGADRRELGIAFSELHLRPQTAAAATGRGKRRKRGAGGLAAVAEAEAPPPRPAAARRRGGGRAG